MGFTHLSVLGCGILNLSYLPMEIAGELHVDFFENLKFTF